MIQERWSRNAPACGQAEASWPVLEITTPWVSSAWSFNIFCDHLGMRSTELPQNRTAEAILGTRFWSFRTQTNADLPTKMHSQRISGASGSQIVRTSHLISNGQGPSEASASARAVATPPNGLTWDLTILKNPLGLHSPFLAVRWILITKPLERRRYHTLHFASSSSVPGCLQLHFWSCLQGET